MQPNIPRLKHAIEVLEGVVAAKLAFDLADWFTHERQEKPKDEWCGTTACAMGYCALDKEFTDQGLRLEARFETPNGSFECKIVTTIQEFNEIGHCKGYELYSASIEYVSPDGVTYRNDWQPVTKFFSISADKAADLFHAISYPVEDRGNPKAVIAKIKHLIAEFENAI